MIAALTHPAVPPNVHPRSYSSAALASASEVPVFSNELARRTHASPCPSIHAALSVTGALGAAPALVPPNGAEGARVMGGVDGVGENGGEIADRPGARRVAGWHAVRIA